MRLGDKTQRRDCKICNTGTGLYLKFKLSNKKRLFVQRANFRRGTSPVPGFRAGDVILSLSHCDVKFISRGVLRGLHPPIKDNEKWRQ